MTSKMNTIHRFSRVDFQNFKAFRRFALNLRQFNILAGPNNAGKSTILTAFRILASALKKAGARKPEVVRGPERKMFGYTVDLSAVSVAEENIFYNYDESEPASVRFRLSNNNALTLYFRERDSCILTTDSEVGPPSTPATFRKQFNCPIGFVPILGPVDHNERLFKKEAARLALFSYTAARNFRNIWFHFPEKFEQFREALRETWPGMDIEPPSIDMSHEKPLLHMFCPEERIPREIFWSGFGFQVWCQMLTHLVQSSDASLFLIDEPDIYLHSDLQRQLLGLLRNLGPDILIATHSTEIITEAEPDDIVVINKRRVSAKRIRNSAELGGVFTMLGSNLNPILTQLAKTRRVVFVEGKDFQLIGKFARRLHFQRIANRADFAVVPVEGFNPERIRTLKKGMETTLGTKIAAAAILDRDYRSEAECDAVKVACEESCDLVIIHGRKEIENFLLVPEALDQAAQRRVLDRSKRTGIAQIYEPCSLEILEEFASSSKTFVTSRYVDARRQFDRSQHLKRADTTSTELALTELEGLWGDLAARLRIVSGKEAFSAINQRLQDRYNVSVTPTAVVDAMRVDDVPEEMELLIKSLEEFSKKRRV